MELRSQQDGTVQIVSVHNARIDAAVAIEFKDAMRQATESGSPTVILDLSEVDFIDSSGLGAIVASMKHMGQDRSLVLAGLTPTVDKVFRLTRMDSVFGVFPTLQTALDAHAA
ncbi:MAG: STAS domain-containing protein [Pseudomonadota bacterium]